MGLQNILFHSFLTFERFLMKRFGIEFLEMVSIHKCYLHQNGLEFEEELNGMPHYGLCTTF